MRTSCRKRVHLKVVVQFVDLTNSERERSTMSTTLSNFFSYVHWTWASSFTIVSVLDLSRCYFVFQLLSAGAALYLLGSISSVCRFPAIICQFRRFSWQPISSGTNSSPSWANACKNYAVKLNTVSFVRFQYMGARRHGQEGALTPSGNVVKCFCALVVTAKRSVDELFMHYFHNLSSASEGKSAQTLTGALSLDPVLSSPDR